MEWNLLLTINITLLLTLFFIGMPVAIAFFCVNIFSLWILMGPGSLLLIINSIYESTTNFSLATIPLYILLGEILFESGAVIIIFNAVDKCIGKVRARLFLVTLLVSTIFAALSGAAIGVAAMLGATILPEMNRRGYDNKLIAGSICSGASLAPIIPPSILCVVVGTLANVSIAKLLTSGIIPGLIISLFCISYIIFKVKLNPKLAPDYNVPKVSFKEKLISLILTLPFVIVVFLVLGLILLGIATPTESAATGVVGALLISILYNKKIIIPIKKSIFTTMKISGMILLIMAGSKAFSQIFAISGASSGILKIVNNLALPPVFMLIFMNAIPLILCCFMDQISLMMILIPIYLPIVELLHFDPIWFWLLILINMTIGGISPPFGYVLFSLKGSAGDRITIREVYLGVIPFIIFFILGMLLVAICPTIATWLPGKL